MSALDCRSPGCSKRVGVTRQPAVLRTLLVMTLWATGAYTVLHLHRITAVHDGRDRRSCLSAVLFLWGLSAAAGIFAGGTLTDRDGAWLVIVLGLLSLALAFASLSASAMLLAKGRCGRAGARRDR